MYSWKFYSRHSFTEAPIILLYCDLVLAYSNLNLYIVINHFVEEKHMIRFFCVNFNVFKKYKRVYTVFNFSQFIKLI